MSIQKSNTLSLSPQHHIMPGSSRVEARELPFIAIAGSVCWACKSPRDDSHTLKDCSGCWKATYCSTKCQVQHWKAEHKAQCKIFRLVGQETKQSHGLTWDEYGKLQLVRVQSAKEKSMDVKNDLGNIVNAIYHQPYCDTCHLTTLDSTGDVRITLSSCAECKMAFWCSETCRNLSFPQHKQELCRILSEHMAYHCMRYSGSILDPRALQLAGLSAGLLTKQPRSTYVPLSCLVSWRDYFELSKNPTAGCISTTNGVTSFDSKTMTNYMNLKTTSDEFTCVLTILAGFEAVVADLRNKSVLTIHLVGAAQWETSRMKLTEELFHLCPGLKHLTVGFVGPNNHCFHISGDGVNHITSNRVESLDSCKECQNDGRCNRWLAYRGLYDEFLTTDLAARNPPDLIVAFNTGHQDSDLDLWEPTLKQILALDTPAMFTSFNEKEAIEEEAALNALGASFMMRPRINKWHGLVSMREWSGPKNKLWYRNLYWYIVKGQEPAAQSSA